MTLWSFHTRVFQPVFIVETDLSWPPLLNCSLWQSEAQATHGEKDSHALVVAAIWERIGPVYLSESCVYHPHTAARLYYELASCWVWYRKLDILWFVERCLFFLFFIILHWYSWPLRLHIDTFQDRLNFIGFMNNKINLLLVVYCWWVAGLSSYHWNAHDAWCRDSPECFFSIFFLWILWKNPTSLSAHPVSLPRWITPFGVG